MTDIWITSKSACAELSKNFAYSIHMGQRSSVRSLPKVKAVWHIESTRCDDRKNALRDVKLTVARGMWSVSIILDIRTV